MNFNILKKEQIWIAEKDNKWSSRFYTMYDFDNIRGDEKRYKKIL